MKFSVYLIVVFSLIPGTIMTHVFSKNRFRYFSSTDISLLTKDIVPSLSYQSHKGSNGRIGILGWSLLAIVLVIGNKFLHAGGDMIFTGAPYYAARSRYVITKKIRFASMIYLMCFILSQSFVWGRFVICILQQGSSSSN